MENRQSLALCLSRPPAAGCCWLPASHCSLSCFLCSFFLGTGPASEGPGCTACLPSGVCVLICHRLSAQSQVLTRPSVPSFCPSVPCSSTQCEAWNPTNPYHVPAIPPVTFPPATQERHLAVSSASLRNSTSYFRPGCPSRQFHL